MTARAVRRAPSAADVAARIDALRRSPGAAGELTAMLAEQSPVFAGRGTTETERLRGYILASFEVAGLPADAVPYVLEELEIGRNPYAVAAAARALRGTTELPAEAPALLVDAIARLRDTDDVVSFEGFATVSRGEVTALVELARTVAFHARRAKVALGELQTLVANEGEAFSPTVRGELERAVDAVARADAAPCCGGHADTPSPAASARRTTIEDLALENQDGVPLTFAEAFSGRPTALAFFYTRCMNPEKCSLTVTKLGRLARLVDEEALDANVGGITYDPAFDRPPRLKAYGVDRGVAFSPRCSLLRTVGPFDPLQDAFKLGVGFGPVTVNRHRLDLVVLDGSFAVAQRFERRLWHEETVLEALRAAAST
jgi:cytochrome oxidase Cu insertion factor (SCO1/SenC/PrrC family)